MSDWSRLLDELLEVEGALPASAATLLRSLARQRDEHLVGWEPTAGQRSALRSIHHEHEQRLLAGEA